MSNFYDALARKLHKRAQDWPAEQAKRQQQIAEAKKAVLAPPPSQEQNKQILQTIRDLKNNEREKQRIEQIRDTDINRYYEEKLDVRYAQLIST